MFPIVIYDTRQKRTSYHHILVSTCKAYPLTNIWMVPFLWIPFLWILTLLISLRTSTLCINMWGCKAFTWYSCLTRVHLAFALPLLSYNIRMYAPLQIISSHIQSLQWRGACFVTFTVWQYCYSITYTPRRFLLIIDCMHLSKRNS